MAKSFSEGAADAVREARKHLGYREGPRNNQNIFGARYGWNFVAWCVQFAWYAGDITGSGGGIPKTASTGAAMRWAKSVGRWRTTPQAGDWSIMVNSKGATIHTDLVESYKNGRLICIGGNTSGTYKGSVNEGNGVYRNDRTAKWKRGRILGFVRPFYGVTVDDVKTVQKAAGLVVDGKIGPATVAGVKRLQAAAGIKADGFPGPSTMSALSVGVGGKGGASAAQPAKPAASKPATSSKITEDGRWGTETTSALQRYLKVTPVDGRTGPDTWKAVQKWLGHPVVDGLIEHQSYKPTELGNGISDNGWRYTGRNSKGSKTIRRLQAKVGVSQDGVVYEGTTKALQRYLNKQA